MYKFELPPELMSRMVAIRAKTKKPLAQQVREAVEQYCKKKIEHTERLKYPSDINTTGDIKMSEEEGRILEGVIYCIIRHTKKTE